MVPVCGNVWRASDCMSGTPAVGTVISMGWTTVSPGHQGSGKYGVRGELPYLHADKWLTVRCGSIIVR